MTDAQFTILVSVIGSGLAGLIGIVKWAVTRLSSALDNNTAAHLKSVEEMTRMSTKLDFVYQATGRVDDFVREEISGAVSVEVPQDDTPVDKPMRPPGRYHKRFKSSPGETKKKEE